MNLLSLFKEYLESLAASHATIKNYLADVKQFLLWYQKTNPESEFQIIDYKIIESYIEDKKKQTTQLQIPLTLRSLERHLSSLRKFFTFLEVKGYIQSSPFTQQKAATSKPISDPWNIKLFKDFLYHKKASKLTVKNYLSDIQAFTLWLDKEHNLIGDIQYPITSQDIDEYKSYLNSVLHASPKTTNRKLSSLRSYVHFLYQSKLLSDNKILLSIPNLPEKTKTHSFEKGTVLLSELENLSTLDKFMPNKSYSRLAPLRLLQKLSLPYEFLEDFFASKIAFPLKLSELKNRALHPERYPQAHKSQPSAQPPFLKNLFYHIRFTRPKWYKIYRSYSFTGYLHVAVIIIFGSAIGILIYQRYFSAQQKKSLAATAPLRILSFQGRLTDSSGNVITNSQQARFIIYNDSSATGSARLWEEVRTINPDEEGVFNVYLGQAASGNGNASLCNNGSATLSSATGPCGIPQNLFGNNSQLWLGITINSDTELTPRQQLATVSYATNAEVLQGMAPITQSGAGQTNVILALDGNSNLTIGGSANPTFQASGGQFTITGQPLFLTTNLGSGANVTISADGLGMINLQKPLTNTSLTNNISTAVGAVEVDDMFAVLATSSGQSAFTLNQNGGGPIFSASSSGSPVFTIGNTGTLTTSYSTGILHSNSSGVISSSAIDISSTDITNTLAVGNGGTGLSSVASGTLLYGSGSTTLTALGIGSANTCLVSNGSAPSWSDCSSTASGSLYFTQSNGSLYANNSTVDFLLGGQATTSAKFGVLNINSGTPTATLSAGSSGGLYFDASGKIATTAKQTLTLGDSTTTGNIILNPSGNVGIGITQPFSLLNVGQYSDTVTTLTLGNDSNAANYGLAAFNNRLKLIAPSGFRFLTGSATGTEVFTINGGNIGIGATSPNFALDLQTSQASTVAAQFFNTNTGTNADGITVKLGNSNSTVSSTNHFVSFETSGIGIVGSIQGNGGQGVSFVTSGIADFAEYLPRNPTEDIPWGSLLCINTSGSVTKCNSIYTNIAGVASEHPTFVGGNNKGNQSVAVGFQGQIYTYVSSKNGPIQAGDFITLSDIAGVGVKAIEAGTVVGKALESFSGDEVGKILVLVSPVWHDPNTLITSSGNVKLISQTQSPENDILFTSNGSYDALKGSWKVKNGETLVQKISAFQEIVVGAMRAGFISTQTLLVEGSAKILGTLQAQFIKATDISTDSLTIASDSVSIAGKSIQDFIIDTVKTAGLTKSSVESPVTITTKLSTNIISPLGDSESITINIGSSQSGSLKSGKLSIKNEQNKEIASISSNGDASFSGQLSASSIQTNDASISGTLSANSSSFQTSNIKNLTSDSASISGTLYANNIQANSIEGLDEKIHRTLQNQTQNNSENQINSLFSSSSASFDLPSFLAAIKEKPKFISLENLSAEFGTFQNGLISLGPTTVNQITVMDTLSLGTNFTLGNNAINLLGADLEIQPLKQGGVNFLSGALVINTSGEIEVNGNATFAKNVTVKGKLATNIISPLGDSDLTISLPSPDASSSSPLPEGGGGEGYPHSSKLSIQNSKKSEVLGINNTGDITASGAGTFSKLNLSLVKPAYALSDTEVEASGSAGLAKVNPYRVEVTIYNTNVTKDSLIYITPVGDTAGQVPTLIRQVPEIPDQSGTEGSFTVGIARAVNKEVKFNWFIVN